MNERATLAAIDRPTLVRYGVLAWFCSLSMITYIDRVCIKQVQEEIEASLGLPPGDIWMAFVVLGVIGIFWVAGFYRWYRDGPREHPGVNEKERDLIEAGTGLSRKPAPLSWATVLKSPTLWCLSFMYFCSNSGWSLFITFDSRILKNDMKLAGWELHLASGAPLFFGGIACMLGG